MIVCLDTSTVVQALISKDRHFAPLADAGYKPRTRFRRSSFKAQSKISGPSDSTNKSAKFGTRFHGLLALCDGSLFPQFLGVADSL